MAQQRKSTVIFSPSPRARHWITIAIAVPILVWIGSAFWLQDLRWSLPTPRPAGLIEPAIGSRAELPVALKGLVQPGVPTLLHFFNPDCPCSRFNLEHVREIAKEFGTRIRVVFVLQTENAGELADASLLRQWPEPAVLDADGSIAHAFGVYSTPQAVVLDGNGALAYRGNYNSSRYCVERASQYAWLALEDLLANRPVRKFGPESSTAYGCALPADSTGAAP